MKNIHVESGRTVPWLVVVHRDAGCEHDCRNPVVNEYPLVGKPVEKLSEIIASVVCESEIQIDVVHAVA